MDKYLGNAFDEGLANLKRVVETQTRLNTGFRKGDPFS